ncbi:MAG: ABC transporter ATP-binding protein [Pirellulales bacterium]
MPNENSKLIVNNLCKEFANSAERLLVLQDVNLTMQHGEDVSIVGPSGSGKSTFLYILGTLDTPSSGTVELDGMNPFNLPNSKLAEYRNRSIGFVFQDHHLLPQLSVLDNVLLPSIAFGVSSAEDVSRAQHLLEAVGLKDRMNHVPAQISGGERQRAAVARALLRRPRLLLADEPTGNLDVESSKKVADLLYDLPKREGAMLVVVTHSQQVAERASRRLRLESRTLIQY